MNSGHGKYRRQLRMLLIAACVSLSAPAGAADAEIKRLIVFGDGYSDTGNAYTDSLGSGGAGIPPVPVYFDGRASNGPVWVERLAEGLGIASPEPMLAGGTNYAWLGAGSTPAGSARGAPDLGRQVGAFLFSGKVPSDDDLVVIWAGLGDFIHAGDGQIAAPDPTDLVRGLVDSVNALADAAGAETRLRVLVANLPPMGQTLQARRLGDNLNPELPALHDRLSSRVNKLLATELRLLAKNRGIDIALLDIQALSREIASDPDAYGFTNINTPARVDYTDAGRLLTVADSSGDLVIDPDAHLYYDDVYPTQNWHRLVAERALEALGVEP